MRNVVDQYEGFVLDLWGVVHNGVTVFPGVVDALERLHAAGKKLVFLSNAPRRAHVVAEQLYGFGITEHLHDGVMSSGEATWRYLDTRSDDWSKSLGRNCLGSALEGTPVSSTVLISIRWKALPRRISSWSSGRAIT